MASSPQLAQSQTGPWAALVDPGISWGWARAGELPSYRPHRLEAALCERMHGRRRRDFLLGRLAARRALVGLTGHCQPILYEGASAGSRPPRGAPRFPAGVNGSISHSGGIGVAGLIPSVACAAIGVDIELGRLSVRAAHLICEEAEVEWVHEAPDRRGAELRLTLALSVKESVLKAVCALSGETVAPQAVRLRFEGEQIIGAGAPDHPEIRVIHAACRPAFVGSCVLIGHEAEAEVGPYGA